MRKVLALTLTAMTLSVGSMALAQSDDAHCGSSANHDATSRDQVYCFHGETLTDGLVGPNDPLLRHMRRPTGVSLLRMRANFVPEMLKSVESL